MTKYDQFIESVMSGEKAVSKYTRLAVERHVRDLKKSEEDPKYP